MASLNEQRAMILHHKRLHGLAPKKGSGVVLAGGGKKRKLVGKTLKNMAKFYGTIALLGTPILGPAVGAAYSSVGVMWLVGRLIAGEGKGKPTGKFVAFPIGFLPNAAKIKFKKTQKKLPLKDRKMLQSLTSKKLMAADWAKIEKFLRMHHIAGKNLRKMRGSGQITAAQMQGAGLFDSIGKAFKSVGKTIVKGTKSVVHVIGKAARAAGKETSRFLAGKTAFKPSMLLTGLSGAALLASMGIPLLAPILGPSATALLGVSRLVAATGRGVPQQGAGAKNVLGMIAFATLLGLMAAGEGDFVPVGGGLKLAGEGFLQDAIAAGKKKKRKGKFPKLPGPGIVCIRGPCGPQHKHPPQHTFDLPGASKEFRINPALAKSLAKGMKGKGLVLAGAGPMSRPDGMVQGSQQWSPGQSGSGLTCKQKQARGMRIACPSIPRKRPSGPFTPDQMAGKGIASALQGALRKANAGLPKGSHRGLRKVGSRQDVWDLVALRTSGGLKRVDLMLNKKGKLVSKAMAAAAKTRFKKR